MPLMIMPIVDRDTTGIREMIEEQVLQINAMFDKMETTDLRYLALD